MLAEQNKALVRRYFEALDNRDPDGVAAVFSPACVIHRPDVATPLVGHEAQRRFLSAFWSLYSEFSSTIESMVADDATVAVRLSHQAVHRTDWTGRAGMVTSAGRPGIWPAMAFFRIDNDKIVEQWVIRDELGMLLQLRGS